MKLQSILSATFSILLAAAAGACSHESEEPSGDQASYGGEEQGHEHEANEEEGHGHEDFPPALRAFHDVFAPIWHGDPGESRAVAACQALDQLVETSGPVGALGDSAGDAGETAEDAADDEISSESSTVGGPFVSAIGRLQEACPPVIEGPTEDNVATVETILGDIHEGFHAILEVVVPEHG